MATTTILHEFERRLEARLARKEITTNTRDTYLNDASRVFEILLNFVPVAAIQGYMEAAGYQGDYGFVIISLADMAREPGHTSFIEVEPKSPAMMRRKRRRTGAQKTLPGLGDLSE
jgi:hypothetical protein